MATDSNRQSSDSEEIARSRLRIYKKLSFEGSHRRDANTELSWMRAHTLACDGSKSCRGRIHLGYSRLLGFVTSPCMVRLLSVTTVADVCRSWQCSRNSDKVEPCVVLSNALGRAALLLVRASRRRCPSSRRRCSVSSRRCPAFQASSNSLILWSMLAVERGGHGLAKAGFCCNA